MVASGDLSLNSATFRAMSASKIFLILGSEEVIAERALKEILNQNQDAEKRVIYCNEIEPGTLTEATAPSLFSEQRALVVKNLQDLDSESHFEIDRYLLNPDPSLTVIFIHKGGVKGKGLVDRIKKVATLTLAQPLKKESERIDFLRQEFSLLQRKITPAALAALTAAYADMRELASAARQIAIDIGGNEAIREDQIISYTQGRKLTTGFDVADAVIAKDAKRSLLATRYALDCGVEPMAIFTAVSTSIKSMLKVIDLPRHAKSFEVAGELSMAPWQVDKARRQLGSWSSDDFELAINELARAEFAVKGGEHHPGYAIERMVLAISSGGALVKSPDQSNLWRRG